MVSNIFVRLKSGDLINNRIAFSQIRLYNDAIPKWVIKCIFFFFWSGYFHIFVRKKQTDLFIVFKCSCFCFIQILVNIWL